MLSMEDGEGDTEGSSEMLQQQRSSVVLSEGDRSNIDVTMENGILESSPAPPIAAA